MDFDVEKHKYTTLQGKELTSVTTFIKFFSHEFDSTGEILTRCAKKEGITEKQLKKRWEDKRIRSANYGIKWHENIEHYIKTGQIRKNKYTNIVNHFVQNFDLGKNVYPEVRIHFEELGLAGTVDLILVNNNKISVQDWKSNEKPITNFSFGRMMKYPINHLQDGKLNHYILQISVYSYLLCLKYGFEPDLHNNCIYQLDRKNEEIKKIPIELKTKEVIDIVSHFIYCKESGLELNKTIDNPPPQSYNDNKSTEDFGF